MVNVTALTVMNTCGSTPEDTAATRLAKWARRRAEEEQKRASPPEGKISEPVPEADEWKVTILSGFFWLHVREKAENDLCFITNTNTKHPLCVFCFDCTD